MAGLAAGLAAGTKLNFLPPAAALVVGLALIVPRGRHWTALWIAGLASLAGGGYWYFRNLVHTGNPLPWIHHLGPVDLPAPEQALGGREAHSVLGYLTDTSAWSDWFFPGLHQAFWIAWPFLGAAALAGLFLAVAQPHRRRDDLSTQGRQIVPSADGLGGRDRVLLVAGLVGLASALAWLIAPTSASGPDGMPKGFESGLRYLAPALILGLALLPTAPILRDRLLLVAQRVTSDNRSLTVGPLALLGAEDGCGAGGYGGRLRISDPAPLPAEALRRPFVHHSRPQRRLRLGPRHIRRPHRHHQHPPVPPLRHRPLQPRPIHRHRTPPRRLRSPAAPAANGAKSSTRATTTT